MTSFGKIGVAAIVMAEFALLVYSPMLGVIVLSFLMYNDKIDYVSNSIHYRLVLLYILVCSLMLGLINLTKIPESDLVWYMEHFHDSRYSGAIDYMKHGLEGESLRYWKEPVYSLLVWIINRLTNDDGAAFKCILTMLNYCIMGYALVLFAKYKELPTKLLIVGLVSLFFIPYIYTMSLQAIRQFLCNSIILLVLVRVCFYEKKDYWLIIVAVLIHSMGFLFIPLLLLPAFDKHWKDAWWWYVALVIFIVGMRFFSGILSDSVIGQAGPASYALQRASEDPNSEIFSHLGLLRVSMVIGFLSLAIYIAYISEYNTEMGVKRFMHTVVYLAIFVLINYNNTELAARFFFFFFPFTPFLIIYGLQIMPKIQKMAPVYFVLLLMFFVNYVYTGPWTYKLETNILTKHIYEYKEPWEIGRGI